MSNFGSACTISQDVTVLRGKRYLAELLLQLTTNSSDLMRLLTTEAARSNPLIRLQEVRRSFDINSAALPPRLLLLLNYKSECQYTIPSVMKPAKGGERCVAWLWENSSYKRQVSGLTRCLNHLLMLPAATTSSKCIFEINGIRTDRLVVIMCIWIRDREGMGNNKFDSRNESEGLTHHPLIHWTRHHRRNDKIEDRNRTRQLSSFGCIHHYCKQLPRFTSWAYTWYEVCIDKD